MSWSFRKIKCPRHFMLKPGADPFIMEPHPLLTKVSDYAAKKYGVKRMVAKRDARGNPIRNPKSYYQPEISSAFAIEHIYDPHNYDCKVKCRGRCLEGHGSVNLRAIKRLGGCVGDTNEKIMSPQFYK